MMFWQKYKEFVEDYGNPINRILTVVLLIAAVLCLYAPYARFDNYVLLYKGLLVVYTAVVILYGWCITGKNRQSLQYLFKNDIIEFMLRSLFFFIVFINGMIIRMTSIGIIFILLVACQFSLVSSDDSFIDLWKNGRKSRFLLRLVAFVVIFILMMV